MSRSYKKFPIIRQGRWEREEIKTQDKRLRKLNLDYSLKNSQYKRVSKGICEWNYRYSWEDAKKDYYNDKRLQEKYTLEEFYLDWMKWTIRK